MTLAVAFTLVISAIGVIGALIFLTTRAMRALIGGLLEFSGGRREGG